MKKYWIHFLMKCDYFLALLFGKKIKNETGQYVVWKNKIYLNEGRLVYYSQRWIFPSQKFFCMTDEGVKEWK